VAKAQGSGTRKDRLGSQIREVIAQVVLFEVKDPSLQMLNITDVELTGDLGLAKVYFYSHGADERARDRLQRSLERAKGFLRRRIGQEIHARVTPELAFYYDESIERGASIEDAIRRARAQDAQLAEELGSPSEEESDDNSNEER
jgi:ribosome-binding factor A